MSDEKVFLVKPRTNLIDILKNAWVEVKDFLPWFACPFVILFIAFLVFLLNLVGSDEEGGFLNMKVFRIDTKKLIRATAFSVVSFFSFMFILEAFIAFKKGQYLTDLFFWELHSRFIIFAFGLALLGITAKLETFKKLFSWRLWVFPCLALMFIGFLNWRFNPILNKATQPFFVKWQWTGVITWLLLFIFQLYLYQTKGIDNIVAFVLSYYGVFLGAAIYELPYLPSYLTYRILTALFFVAILLFHKWKPTYLTIVSLAPLSLSYFAFGFLPYWSVRLTCFPLILIIPFGLVKSEKQK